MKYLEAICVTLSLILLTGCGVKESDTSAQNPAEHQLQTVEEFSDEELLMPVIPDSIEDPSERARFASLHFWDDLDFTDTISTSNRALMEQNFVNFITILSLSDERTQEEAVNLLMGKAKINQKALDMLTSIADDYLDNPNSPMRSEDLYIVFLRQRIEDINQNEAVRLRAEDRLEAVMKNRPGDIAADFEYIDRESKKKMSLFTTPVGSEGMFVVFYDPDCSHCKEILGSIRSDEKLNTLIAEGRVTVLAVDVKDDRNAWDESKNSMPSNWIVGFNSDGIIDREAYSLPALPSVYVLSPDYRVIGKDVTVNL